MKSKSYYALSGGQGLTSSGIGEMLPWPPGSPDASFRHTHIAGTLTALPRTTGTDPVLAIPSSLRTESLPESEQGLDPTGKAVTGAKGF